MSFTSLLALFSKCLWVQSNGQKGIREWAWARPARLLQFKVLVCVCVHTYKSVIALRPRMLRVFFRPPEAPQMNEPLAQVSQALFPQHVLQLAVGIF